MTSSLFLSFFFSSRRRHTRYWRDWSSDVCSSDLGEGDRRERHRLLVLAAPGRQLVLHLDERLREARDVAVAEDAENAREQRDFLAVEDGPLRDEVAHERLRRGEADRLHGPCPSPSIVRSWRAQGIPALVPTI